MKHWISPLLIYLGLLLLSLLSSEGCSAPETRQTVQKNQTPPESPDQIQAMSLPRLESEILSVRADLADIDRQIVAAELRNMSEGELSFLRGQKMTLEAKRRALESELNSKYR